jgi:hypothetical protein
MTHRIVEGYVYPSHHISISAIAALFIFFAVVAFLYFTGLWVGSLADVT